MARQRTDPAEQPVINEDRIVSVGPLIVAYNEDGTYNPGETYFQYTANNLDAEGNVVASHQVRIPWSDIPRGFKSPLLSLFSGSKTHAANNGYIGAGTDSGDPQ